MRGLPKRRKYWEGPTASDSAYRFQKLRVQVPVLANPAVLRKPLAESQDITLYIAEHYPRLLPLALRNEIIQRLSDLHTINYFSLSFTGRPDVALGLKNRVIKALQDPKSSAKYQELLKHKLSIIFGGRIENDKIGGLTSNRVAEAEERTSAVLGDLVVRQTQEGKGRGPWILDTEYPTALDAHLAIFLARLQDVNRHDLIPPELSEYVKTAIAGPEFSAALKGVEGGRTVGKKV
ncbi:hypothetical protein N7448_001133 [Penicillium atrosanguineum]|nr:hypothetical protein N7448_001133 [Penicillium atrosanguineum]